MNSFSMQFVAEFAELLTTALIHFVWQGAFITLILLVTVKMLDVRTARLRYLRSDVCPVFRIGRQNRPRKLAHGDFDQWRT